MGTLIRALIFGWIFKRIFPVLVVVGLIIALLIL
jgi:hypothetical protein